jgi:RNA polymerase sigma factor (sigma-70 family)
MVSVLSRLLGLQNIGTAQDIVQDTLLLAMTTWGYNSIPDNPSAWLYKVAKNKAVDFLRRQKKFRDISPQYAYLIESEYSLAPTVHNLFLENEINDSQLRMIFACCHPSIPEDSQVAIALKTLCGLSINEIARAFVTSDETISKRIYRAKEKFNAENIGLEVPLGAELQPRLDAVLKSLYLLFSEGYNSSHPEKLIREDLCMEAMRLCLLLTRHQLTGFPRCKALLALMCFQSSRLNARLDDNGNIILLKYQDRSKWHKPLIQKGFEYLEAAAEPFEVSVYHLEASIACEYATAADYSQTNWKRILLYYDRLYQLQPTSIVALNRAVVVGELFGAAQGIEAIENIPDINSLQNFYLLHAILGELYTRAGEKEKAENSFSKAAGLTGSFAEKNLLLLKRNGVKGF